MNLLFVISEDGFNPDEVYEEYENQTALHAAALSGSLIVLHVLIQVFLN